MMFWLVKLLHFGFFCSIFLLSGCTRSSLLLVNTLAQIDQYDLIENLPYRTGLPNSLDIYLPDPVQSQQAQWPVIIFFYGGCWGGCTMYNKSYYRFVGQTIASNNFITVIGDYRRYPEVKFSGIIKDAKQIVEWVKHNIHQFHGDPNRLFLMGHSSGAHLAAMLTLDETQLEPETYQSVRGFIGLAGPYDFLPLTKPYQQFIFGPKDKYPDSQPINFVSGSEPPVLLLQGDKDTKVLPRNSLNLEKKINDFGGCVETKIYPDMDHTDILAALSIPFRGHEPVLSNIMDFVNYYSSEKSHCKRINLKLTHQR